MMSKKAIIKLIQKTFLFLIFNSTFFISSAQNYFRSPLDIPLKLAGNFGEIRSNHFHSGLDLKTDSVEGKNVFAVADGYVSRIKVSAFGYGNALYITHPNGYVSLYGHLQQYSDSVASYVKQKQIEKQSFEIELFPDSNLFRFKQGDLIAKSGNSGGSAGPHLHFELRDAVTEKIINPLIFGYAIDDTIPPVIHNICVYENRKFVGVDSLFDTASICFDVQLKSKSIILNLKDTLKVTSDVQFGYGADDFADDGLNSLGIFKVQLIVDDSIIWQYQFETFAFDETRFVNAHVDYAEKVLTKSIYERCYRLPGDSFSVYLQQSPQVKRNYNVKGLHHGILKLSDYNGNTTILNFCFKANRKKTPVEKTNKSWVHLKFNQPYNLKLKNFLLQFSDKSFYDDIDLKYHVTRKTTMLFSSIHNINDRTIPLRTAATISIKADLKTKQLQDKAIIVMMNDDGTFTNIGGLYKNGSVSALIRTLGSYAVAIDTTPPNIAWQNANDSLSKSDTLLFLIKDDLSGIATYKVTVNDESVVPVYDAKNDLLKINCSRFNEGEQILKVDVTDVKGNSFLFINKVYMK